MKYVVKTVEDTQRMGEALARTSVVAFDTETTGLEFDRRMIGLSFSDGEQAWYVPLRHTILFGAKHPDNAPIAETMDIVTKVFKDPGKTIWIHNAKFDIKTLRNEGFKPGEYKAEVLDCMLASWLLEPAGRHGLKPLVRENFGYEMTPFQWNPPQEAPIEEMGPYAADDALWLHRLGEHLYKQVQERDLEKVFRELEMPICFIIEQIEEDGFKLDRNYLLKASVVLDKQMHDQVALLGQLLGVPLSRVNIGSTQWLASQFINQRRWWGIARGWEPGKSGFHSTSKDRLLAWAKGTVAGTSEVGQKGAQIILRYRKLQKLRSTYTTSLVELLDANNRVHTSFLQSGTDTGRFASRAPNLQNVPRPIGKAEFPWEEGLPSIRRAFISEDGWVILGADYSQVELRLMAHFSRDENMMRVYILNGDIHQQTADACGCSRQDAKPINFGLNYGMSAPKLAADLGCSVQYAKAYIKRYFEMYSGVAAYQQQVANTARKHGYVTTLLGRRRYIPEILSPDKYSRGHAERQAINTKIQGSAADLIKVAMRNVARRIHRDNLRPVIRMLSQVHDEIIFEVKAEHVEGMAAMVKEEMESVVTLRVPLVAEPKWGKNWEAAK